jgi:hypothetical protein
MADNQNISATPYPFYATGGNDDDSFRAALTSHASASVERNQDSQFSAGRDQLVHRDVVAYAKDAVNASTEAKYELTTALKDAEIRNVDRFSELKDLIRGQAERDLAEARAELRAERAAAASNDMAKTLAAILAKLSV